MKKEIIYAVTIVAPLRKHKNDNLLPFLTNFKKIPIKNFDFTSLQLFAILQYFLLFKFSRAQKWSCTTARKTLGQALHMIVIETYWNETNRNVFGCDRSLPTFNKLTIGPLCICKMFSIENTDWVLISFISGVCVSI